MIISFQKIEEEVTRRTFMKKEKDKKELKKARYLKPVLTKHKKLKDVTASVTLMPALGCTKF